jgi:SAM-dependent methyltransferase
MIETNVDKAGEHYWSDFWKSAENLPPPAMTNGRISGSYVVRQLDELFSRNLPKMESAYGKKLMEIGCGNSIWLSYFHQRFGYEVHGLDYSEYGCEQTRKILARDKVPGTVYLADVFNPPIELIEKFDVVCSFGVVEHFSDTEAAISAACRFLKPGGILITTIPNLMGPTGFLQKHFYRPVYDIHVVMDKDRIVSAVEHAGLKITAASYFCTLSFGVSLEPIHSTPVKSLKLKKFVLKFFQSIGWIFHQIDTNLIRLPKSKYTSEGIFTIAVKQ